MLWLDHRATDPPAHNAAEPVTVWHGVYCTDAHLVDTLALGWTCRFVRVPTGFGVDAGVYSSCRLTNAGSAYAK